MMPGMRGMNSKQMKAQLKRMGIDMDDLEAEEVRILLKDKVLVIRRPEVQSITVRGERSFQISGTVEEEERGAPAAPAGGAPGSVPGKKPRYTKEDVKLVMEQAKCSEADARAALEETDGEPAEAILKLIG